jgi:membrane-associated protein
MGQFFHALLHLDDSVRQLILDHGSWVYGIVFAVIFVETGLVIMPFLPGDSLLFALGLFANPGVKGSGQLNVWILFFSLTFAAFLGDNVNYQIGKHLGARLFRNENSKIFRRSYLDKTHAFFEKHGGWTLVLARFVPIIRTFAPFVAGMGTMTFPRFLMWSVLGGVTWVGVCLFAGYFFGQIPVVRENFEIMVLGIVVVSIVPMVLKFLKMRKEAKATVIRG